MARIAGRSANAHSPDVAGEAGFGGNGIEYRMNPKIECWRPVPCMPGVFASSHGMIRRIYPTGRVTTQSGTIGTWGYLLTRINHRTWRVHRLVCLAFKPNPRALPDVNHKDGVKTNNRITNLEWCTPLHNTRHSVRTGLRVSLRGENHGSAKLTEKQARRIYKLASMGIPVFRIAARYNVDESLISLIRSRKIWKHIDMEAA